MQEGLLPIAYCILIIAYCLLPIAYCPLPSAYYLYWTILCSYGTYADKCKKACGKCWRKSFCIKKRKTKTKTTLKCKKDDFKSYLSFHLLKSTKYIIMHRNNSVHSIKDDVPDNADEVMCVDWSSWCIISETASEGVAFTCCLAFHKCEPAPYWQNQCELETELLYCTRAEDYSL